MVKLAEQGVEFAFQSLEINGDADFIELFGTDEYLNGPVVSVFFGAVSAVAFETVGGGEFADYVEFKNGEFLIFLRFVPVL